MKPFRQHRAFCISTQKRFKRKSRARRSGSAGRPSFGQDVLKKRRTEIEFLNGYVSEKGREVNIPTPFNDEIIDIVMDLGIGFDPDPKHLEKLIKMLPY